MRVTRWPAWAYAISPDRTKAFVYGLGDIEPPKWTRHPECLHGSLHAQTRGDALMAVEAKLNERRAA